MSQQEMESSYSQRERTYPPYTSYQGRYYNERPPFYDGQKIPLGRTSLVPPLSQRLLLGLVSAIVWVLLIGFGLISYLGDQGTPNLRLFLFLITMAFSACLVGINIIFCCVGLLLTRDRNAW
jgi:hypothetical protein